MIRSVRAGGFAAAVLGFAVSIFMTALPSEAGAGTPAAMHFGPMAHAEAQTPDAEAAIAGQASMDPEAAAMAERMIASAEAAVPQPRTLGELVDAYARTETADEEQDCLASAVYFEARGEPIAGQLAVAEVVMNRAASGRYPATICGVVVQPWQFSFVNATGAIPAADRDSASWRRAVAIARIAQDDAARETARDVLWYHADYVAPSWGRRLDRQEKIGLHIFYS
jgi:spore germination cell wall hydrolase CwlJ-like protein